MNAHLGFEVAAGSIPGRDHIGRNEVLLGRNNQDALHWATSENALVTIVADGCGSAPFSEFGARYGARLIATMVRDRYEEALLQETVAPGKVPDDLFWQQLHRAALQNISLVAAQLTGSLGSKFDVLRDHFLFTVLGVLITRGEVVFFWIGDGVFGLNGTLNRLEPESGNRPQYLAYGLIPGRTERELVALGFKRSPTLQSSDISSILIGTDGVADLADAADRPVPGADNLVGPVSQFWDEDRYFQNQDAVRRRLAVINREVKRQNSATGYLSVIPGLLRDDTTLIVLRSTERSKSNDDCIPSGSESCS